MNDSNTDNDLICCDSTHTNKKTICITLSFLEKLISRFKICNKNPVFKSSINRNDKENFVITSTVEIIKK
jgi:hypothetical protein